MDYQQKWDIVRFLGEGGQAKVHLVNRKCRSASWETTRKALLDMCATVVYEGTQERAIQAFHECVLGIIRTHDPSQQGALKALHKPEDARDHLLAKDRIAREIEIMSKNIHRSLVRVLDVDSESEWYVSEYHPHGTLADRRDIFKGNVEGALRAIRPLVEGVGHLHKQGYVHRDIKPHNVFLGSDDSLRLGDFGLVYFVDDQHTRVSATYENVGSRDWMPAWAMGMRIDQVRPTFDVFSLGKLLWAMISGRQILQLWYYNKPEFNLELMFPKSRSMRFANSLFAKCIVEEEKDCIENAEGMLDEIDKILFMLKTEAEPFPSEGEYPCKICGIGTYKVEVGDSPQGIRNFLGCTAPGTRRWRVLACSHCGNIQFFSYEVRPPKGWRKQ
ncbi:MAG: protein kinase [Phycisphaerales bacterium]